MMKFNRVAIRDPAVNNIEGATLLVPDGWLLEGGFVWMPLFSIQANLLIRVSDPRTWASAQTMPLQQYVWTQQTAVPMQLGQNWLGSVYLNPPQHPAEFVQGVWMRDVLRHMWGARLERVEDSPQYAAETTCAAGGGRTVWATRMRYSYQYGGRGWEEDVYSTFLFEQPVGGVMLWQALGHTLRAPAGELDRMTPLLAVPMHTLRVTLEWSAMLDYVRQLYRQNRQRQMENTRRLGEMWAQYRDEARRAHQQVYEEQQASQDRLNFARREILGGVETYVDPFQGRAVELPAGYQNYWVSNQGDVICSETPINPQQGSTAQWHQMERYKPFTQPRPPWS